MRTVAFGLLWAGCARAGDPSPPPPTVADTDPVVPADTGAFAGAAAPIPEAPELDDFTPPTDTAWQPPEDLSAGWLTVDAIFHRRCTPCHIGGETAGLRLSDGYDAWIHRTSNVVDVPLVQPGDPQGSYLWRKVQGTHTTLGGSGQRMPSDLAPLPREERDVIAAWIRDGATFEEAP
jgi:hypothetical protein